MKTNKFKQFWVFIKNWLTPITKLAAIKYLEKNGYIVTKKGEE